jgi:hypothetical protein
MKKFIINYVRGQASIIEVECEILPRDSISSLKDGEWYAVITKPEFLFEKHDNGSLLPPTYCWFAFYDSIELATSHLKKITNESLLRDRERSKVINPSIEINFSLSEVDDIINNIKVIKL